MKKIVKNIPLIFFIILFYGCAAVRPEIYNPDKQIYQPILPLQIHIMEPNIEEGYFGGKENIVSKDRIMEARYIIYKDFKRNIFQSSNKKYGFAFIHINREKTYVNWIWMIPFASTIGFIGLLGVPIISQTAEIDVKLKIFDTNIKLIAQYEANGKETEYGAMYWGYECFAGAIRNHNNTLSQVVNAKALTNALNSLKEQIQLDTLMINNALINPSVSIRQEDLPSTHWEYHLLYRYPDHRHQTPVNPLCTLRHSPALIL